jgi:hypothetical protein
MRAVENLHLQMVGFPWQMWEVGRIPFNILGISFIEWVSMIRRLLL